MSDSHIRLTSIPNVLVASSPRALRRLMLLNNKRSGRWYRYDIIWNDTEKKWYAWYVDDMLPTERAVVPRGGIDEQ